MEGADCYYCVWKLGDIDLGYMEINVHNEIAEIPQGIRQLELAEASRSENVLEYLGKPNTRVNALKEIDGGLSEPMSGDCIGAVIIPAHNEENNIGATLNALNQQEFSVEAGLSLANFEVIVVENNSTDGTANVVRRWIVEHAGQTKLKVNLVSEQISTEERGVGAARKIGADLAIYRSNLRGEEDTKKFYILGLDADNPEIPADHLEKYVKAFKEKQAECLVGGMSLKPGELGDSRHLEEIAGVIREWLDTHESSPETRYVSGFNHGIERGWYIRIGGYPRIKTGEDVWVGTQTKKLGKIIEQVDSKININPRRIVFDPRAFFSGDAYMPEVFEANNESVRRGDTTSNTKSVSGEEGLNTFLVYLLDRRAVDAARASNLPVNGFIRENRDWVINYVKINGLSEEIIPDEKLFWAVYGLDVIFRQELSVKEKTRKFNEGTLELSRLVGAEEGIFMFGMAAEFIRFNDVEAPPMPRIAIEERGIEGFRNKMKVIGYELYDLGTWDREGVKFCRRVDGDESLIDKESLVYIRSDGDGIPILEEGKLPLFAVSVYEETGAGIKFKTRERMPIGVDVKKVEFMGETVKIPDDVVLMVNADNSPDGQYRLQKRYSSLEEKEKLRYVEYTYKRLSGYATFLENYIEENIPSKNDDEITDSLVEMILAQPERKSQEERKDGAISAIKLALENIRKGSPSKTEILKVVVNLGAPTFLRSDLVRAMMRTVIN